MTAVKITFKELPDKPCIRVVDENLRLMEEGKALNQPLAYLNRSCFFKQRYDQFCDIVYGKVKYPLTKEQKIRYKEWRRNYQKKPEWKEYIKEYNQRPEVIIKRRKMARKRHWENREKILESQRKKRLKSKNEAS